MSFLAGYRLWLLLLVALLGLAYVLVQRQRRQYAVRFTNVDLLASVAPRRPGWRRHLAAVCLLLALVLIVMAFARPARAIQVPRETATVMLAVDVSQSMRATDVRAVAHPGSQASGARLRRFLANPVPARARGLRRERAGAGAADPPAVARAERGREPATPAADRDRRGNLRVDRRHRELAARQGQAASGADRPPLRRRHERRATELRGRGGGEEEGHAGLDDRLRHRLRHRRGAGRSGARARPTGRPSSRIADETGGRYATATTENDLRRTYEDLGSRLAEVTRKREVTVWFVGAALAFAFAAAGASLVWTSRLP